MVWFIVFDRKCTQEKFPTTKPAQPHENIFLLFISQRICKPLKVMRFKGLDTETKESFHGLLVRVLFVKSLSN